MAALAAGLLLAGCSTDDEGPGSATGATGAACDPGALSGALGIVLQESRMTVDSIDGFECADEWAVVQASVSGEQVPSFSEQYLFVARDSAWVLRSPEGACGSVDDSGIRPSDADVPESLWEQACGDL
jgi:hypothetical protein